MEEEKQTNQSIEIRELDQNDHLQPLQFINLELQPGFQQEQYVKDLKKKVLFAIQGLGSVNTILRNGKKFETYIKGPYCQESLKDLVKLLRNDKPQNSYIRIILSQYNIIQTDLLQLLALHLQDKKLSFWVIALMAMMTNKPSKELCQQKQQKIKRSLLLYKETFVKQQALTNLIIHIADYFKIPKQKRYLAYLQMLQYSFVLIRNLLQVKDEGQEKLHFKFVLSMIKQEAFNPVLYLIQIKDQKQVLEKTQVLLLEICYHTFTCFDPEKLFQKTVKKSNILQLSLQIKRKHPNVSRHSRFMPIFQKKQPYERKILHKLEQQQRSFQNQRKIPNRICDLLKIQKIGHQYIPENLMIIEQQNDGNSSKVQKVAFQICKEFLQIQYQILCKLIFPLIKSNSPKISDENVLQYVLLAYWAITMTTSKYRFEIENAPSIIERTKVQYELMQIVYIVQNEHFQFLYNLLFTQVTKKLKRLFKHSIFHAGLSLFYRYLELLEVLKKSNSISDRKNATVLMGYMFKHQISRVLKLAFQYVIQEQMLKKLVIIIEKFFTLLEQYTHGRPITVTTNRQLKAKIKKPNSKANKNAGGTQQNLMQREMINEYPQGFQGFVNTQDEQYLALQEKIKRSKNINMLNTQQTQLRFQEKKCNIQKVVTLLKGQWLFFQANTLVIFQQLLQEKQLQNKYKEIIRHICKSFLKLLRINRLALVESLFRFSTLNVKDQIMKNYQQTKPAQFQEFRHENPILLNGLSQQFEEGNSRVPEVVGNETISDNKVVFGDSQYLGSYQIPFTQ